MPEPVAAFIALGANLGKPENQVEAAILELANLPATRLTHRSALFLSHAVGFAAQPDYINAVARLETSLAPRVLLQNLLDIERRHGRQRTFRDAPRTLDLDILLYDSLVIDEPGLHLPHPRMHQRAFVLAPLVELAPELDIPGHGSARKLLDALDPVEIKRLPGTAALPRSTSRDQ